MRIFNDKVISDGAMTGTSVVTSNVIWLAHIANWSAQLNWVRSSGSLTGSVKIQVSNSPAKNGILAPIDNAVWSDLSGATYSVTDAASGNTILSMVDATYLWARVVYTNATGVGVLQCYVNGKGF